MKNFLFLLSACTLLSSTSAFAQFSHSNFGKVFKTFFATTSVDVTKEQIRGQYIGNCIDQNDVGQKAILTTRPVKVTTRANVNMGPKFPEVDTVATVWKTAVRLISYPKRRNAKNFDHQFWASPESENIKEVLTAQAGLLVGQSNNQVWEIKKGTDQDIYVLMLDMEARKRLACYFYRKI